MAIWKTASAVAIAVCVAAGSAAAKEQTLKFRLVTTEIDSLTVDAPNVEGSSVGASKAAGVAIFEDGRIAFKDYVMTVDNRGKEGNYTGYSTYIFQNGDTLTLKFDGGWSPTGNGGDYEVLSGTGAFEGASGTGRFDAIKEPWEGAKLWESSFNLKLPDK